MQEHVLERLEEAVEDVNQTTPLLRGEPTPVVTSGSTLKEMAQAGIRHYLVVPLLQLLERRVPNACREGAGLFVELPCHIEKGRDDCNCTEHFTARTDRRPVHQSSACCRKTDSTRMGRAHGQDKARGGTT
ncbi:MAG: hypothetical protein AMS21_04495 [Gemmatimonas sp. SG8_38_2]|nr:MAG: hypothetical protein AMS21_04495 [Gemmatimonas sp. SG8_38_2]